MEDYPLTEALETGNRLIAGQVFSEQVPLAADTYYPGMRLEYQADGTATADGGNSGTGTVTAVVAGPEVKPGDWVLIFTAALEANLVDPDGNVVAEDITLTQDDSITVKRAGITMTITDDTTSGTAFSADEFFTIAIEAAGEYIALDEGKTIAIYSGPEKTLSSAGYGTILTGGEIYEGALVDASDSALTITEAIRAELRLAGFAPRKEA